MMGTADRRGATLHGGARREDLLIVLDCRGAPAAPKAASPTKPEPQSVPTAAVAYSVAAVLRPRRGRCTHTRGRHSPRTRGRRTAVEQRRPTADVYWSRWPGPRIGCHARPCRQRSFRRRIAARSRLAPSRRSRRARTRVATQHWKRCGHLQRDLSGHSERRLARNTLTSDIRMNQLGIQMIKPLHA
jgi:hypothetical protein